MPWAMRSIAYILNPTPTQELGHPLLLVLLVHCLLGAQPSQQQRSYQPIWQDLLKLAMQLAQPCLDCVVAYGCIQWWPHGVCSLQNVWACDHT
eukprot:6355005-Amphidinium_carterae.1